MARQKDSNMASCKDRKLALWLLGLKKLRFWGAECPKPWARVSGKGFLCLGEHRRGWFGLAEIRIGTSGYSFPDWVGTVYPKNLQLM